MAFGYLISSVVRYSGNGATFFARQAAATTSANTALQRHLGLISKNDAAMARYKARMEAASMAQNKLITGLTGGLALAGGAALVYGITKAAQLERAMTGVQIATSATADEYTRLRAQVIAVSGMTAQSAPTIAREMAEAARVAFHDPKQLMAIFPQMAKYADVRFMAHGEDPVRSIEQMSQVAHYFGAYTAEKMGPLLDNVARLQFTTRAELSQLVTQGKYFIRPAIDMGVSQDTIFQYLATMGQTGFLAGRGGTSMKNLVLGAMSVTPTAHLSKAKAAAISDLGLRDGKGILRFITPKGDLDLVHMVEYLRQMRDHMKAMHPRTGGGRFLTDVGAIWGQSALPLIATLVDKATQQQEQRNIKAFRKIPGVDGQWHKYFNDVFYQWNTFATNMQNLFTVVMLPTLPYITHFFFQVNSVLGPLVSTIAKNPGMGLRIAEVVAALTALFAIRATIGTAQMILGVASALGVLSSGGKAAGAAAGLTTTAKALRLLDGIFLAGLGGRMIGFVTKFKILTTAIDTFGTVVGGSGVVTAARALGTLGGAIAGFVGVIGALGPGAAWLFAQGTKPGTGRADQQRHDASAFPGRYTDKYGNIHTGDRQGHVLHRDGTVTIESVHIHVDGSKDKHATAKTISALLSNPRSLMASAGGALRTHHNIPRPLSVALG